MSIRDAWLPVLDRYRGAMATAWDLRRYQVFVRVTSWTGDLPGAPGAVKTVVETSLGKPRAVAITSRDIIGSGGFYQDQDMRIGPLTPTYVSGGVPGGTPTTVFDPPIGATATEVLFRIVGPGTDPSGDWYQKISQNNDRNFSYSFVVRKTATQPA